MGSGTAGMEATIHSSCHTPCLHNLNGNEDVKTISGKAFAAGTRTVSNIAWSLPCSDMFNMPLPLTRPNDKGNACEVVDPERRATLEYLSTSQARCEHESVGDAILWIPGSEVKIFPQGNNRVPQILDNSSSPSVQQSTLVGDLDCLKYTTDIPLVGTLIDMLECCRRVPSPAHAKQAVLHLCSIGLEAHKDVGNYLVPILVECDCIEYAKQLFYRLTHRNEHSWTSLIQCHSITENHDQALRLYDLMLCDFVQPSNFTYVVLLKVCAQANNVEMGKFFHAAVTKGGTEEDTFVSSILVDMYTKCRLLSEAKYVLHQMPVPDAFPLTSIISGYVELGFAKEALLMMEELAKVGLSSDAHMMSCFLRACTELGTIEEGFKLHNQLIEMGFNKDIFVGNALMDMYAKCGSLLEVEKVFEVLPIRDMVSWTTMIAAYVEHGCNKEALGCLESMQEEGISPVAATFVCVLRVCTRIDDIHDLRFLHSEALKYGIEKDISVSNTLVDVYAKCLFLGESLHIVNSQPTHSTVSWTALMNGYLEQGDFRKVMNGYEQIQMAGICADEALSACVLKACGNLGELDKVHELHINISKVGFDTSLLVGNTLISAYAKCDALFEACTVFEKQIVHNVTSWNALLAAYSDFGRFKEAWMGYCQMQSDGILTDVVSYACMLKVCGSAGAIDKGMLFHTELLKKGYDADVTLANTLIDMYGKCGFLAESQLVFDMLDGRVLVSWNALLQSYAVLKSDEGLSFFQQMQVDGYTPDVVTWNIIILCYAERGEKEKACLLFAKMLEQCVIPNDVVFVSMLKGCNASMSIETAGQLHARLCRANGYEPFDATISTTLIDTYSKCGRLHYAYYLLGAMPARIGEAWTALITGYAGQGNSKLVFSLFFEMMERGMQPDQITFLGILNACSHVGLLEEGQTYFEDMCKSYYIVPDVEHLTCMVNLFGRTGHLDLVMKVVENLPLKVDTVAIQTVIDACGRSSVTSFGSKAFHASAFLDRTQAGLYVHLGNLYANGVVSEEVE